MYALQYIFFMQNHHSNTINNLPNINVEIREMWEKHNIYLFMYKSHCVVIVAL